MVAKSSRQDRAAAKQEKSLEGLGLLDRLYGQESDAKGGSSTDDSSIPPLVTLPEESQEPLSDEKSVQERELAASRSQHLAALDRLSTQDAYNEAAATARECHARMRNMFEADVPKLPSSGAKYETYRTLSESGDPFLFLVRHEIWGRRLRIGNPKLAADHLFKDELRKFDSRLLKALHNHFSETNNTVSAYAARLELNRPITLNDILPPQDERLSREIALITDMGVSQEALIQAGLVLRQRSLRADSAKKSSEPTRP